MASGPLITVAQVREAIGQPGAFADNTPDRTQLDYFIRYASGSARQDVRRASGADLDDAIGTGDVDRDVVIGVLVTVVLRAIDQWRRGFGVRSRAYLEETTEYNEGVPETSQLVYLTEGEVQRLTPIGGASSESFTITPAGHGVTPASWPRWR